MPASTPRGFPYPLPTEPVAEGAQAIRNLAEALDSYFAAEVAYVEKTTTVGVSAGSEGASDLILSDVARTYAAVPHVIDFYSPLVATADAANAWLTLCLFDGGTALGFLGRLKNTNVASSTQAPVFARRRLTPSGGSHTYLIRAFVLGGPGSVGAGLGGSGTFLPMSLRIAKAR